MKRISIVFLALFLAVPLLAQEGGEPVDGFKRGYRGIVELGGVYFEDDFLHKIHIINGYQFNPHFSLGLGTGLDYAGTYAIPAFVNFRVNFNDAKLSPCLSLDAGFFAYTFTNYYLDALVVFFNPTIGIKYCFADKINLLTGIGYYLKVGSAPYNQYGGGGTFLEHGIGINVGLSF